MSCVANRVNCRETYGDAGRYGNPQPSQLNGIEVGWKVQRSGSEQPSDKLPTSARHLQHAGDEMIHASGKPVENMHLADGRAAALELRRRPEEQHRQHADVVLPRGSKLSACRQAPSARIKPTSNGETPRGQRRAEFAGNSVQGRETCTQPQQVVLAARCGVRKGATPSGLNGRGSTEHTSALRSCHGIVRSSGQPGKMMLGRHLRRHGRRDRPHPLAEQWLRRALRDLAPQLRGPRGVSRVANRVNCREAYRAMVRHGNPQPSQLKGIEVGWKVQRLDDEEPTDKSSTSARLPYREGEIVQSAVKAVGQLRKSHSDSASAEHHLPGFHLRVALRGRREHVRNHRAEPRHAVSARQPERDRRDFEGHYLVRGPGGVSCQVDRVNCREPYGAMVRYGNPQPSRPNGIEVGRKVQRLGSEQPSDKLPTSARHLLRADEEIVHAPVKAGDHVSHSTVNLRRSKAVVKPTSNGETPPGQRRAEPAGNSEQGRETCARSERKQHGAGAGAVPVRLNGGRSPGATEGIVRTSGQPGNHTAVQPRRAVAVQPWPAASAKALAAAA